MTANLRAYLVLCAVFLLGGATGAGAMLAYGRRGHAHLEGPRGHAERRLATLTRELKLTSEQATQLAAILERQREPRSKLMRETMQRCGDPLRKLRDVNHAEIATILTAEQKRLFEAWQQEHSRTSSIP